MISNQEHSRRVTEIKLEINLIQLYKAGVTVVVTDDYKEINSLTTSDMRCISSTKTVETQSKKRLKCEVSKQVSGLCFD